MPESRKIAISPEYQKNLDKLETYKTELSRLISERDVLENTIRKNLEALYKYLEICKNSSIILLTSAKFSINKKYYEIY